ncbi:STAS domain-containing protein [Virgibacillus sp. C22-A2]|uniref:STAS domain-containing protein n=1 Tax=Virgibacillus tibetensis TaxID=3042313 RepID=A0ABU6KDU5_9BACI|nr:STAS domain-containing protein [Virgibacillus sp. C22-A2]
MDLIFSETQDIKEFLSENRSEFEDKLLAEASTVRDKIDEIKSIGNIQLLDNAYRLTLLVVEEETEKVIEFAGYEGKAWAKSSIPLSFKLEWVQAIRKTLWIFLYEFDRNKENNNWEDIYIDGSRINELIDEFFKGFFISYSNYKDELIEQQTKLVENLSVPIIPISANISILPLIGKIDTYRANIIEEKVLMEIGKIRVQTLIMDMSGIAEMETDAIHYLMKLLDGVAMMGCSTIITGLRPEIVKNIVDLDISFGHRVETQGTLQQVLQNYINPHSKLEVNDVITGFNVSDNG